MNWWIVRTAQGGLAVVGCEGEPDARRVRGPFASDAEAWLELRRLESFDGLAGLGLVLAGGALLWLIAAAANWWL